MGKNEGKAETALMSTCTDTQPEDLSYGPWMLAPSRQWRVVRQLNNEPNHRNTTGGATNQETKESPMIFTAVGDHDTLNMRIGKHSGKNTKVKVTMGLKFAQKEGGSRFNVLVDEEEDTDDTLHTCNTYLIHNNNITTNNVTSTSAAQHTSHHIQPTTGLDITFPPQVLITQVDRSAPCPEELGSPGREMRDAMGSNAPKTPYRGEWINREPQQNSLHRRGGALTDLLHSTTTTMDFHLHGGGGGSPSSTATSSDHHHHRNNNNSSLHPHNGQSADPMHSWWESISKARSHMHLLSSLLPSSADSLSSLADTDRPARSLLLSSAAYASLSAALSSGSSGSSSDALCQWLYDTYLSSDPDLRLVVLSYLPILISVYLRRVHHPISDDPISLAGFEAVLLAIHSSEAKSRNGNAVTISIPDLSQPSLYHSPRNPVKSSNPNLKPSKPTVGVLTPPLEPQMAVKSTKRACIVGVALDCYYKHISQMPSWSKRDFCDFATVWAGDCCPCTSEFDRKPVENIEGHEIDNGFRDDVRVETDDIENVDERIRYLDIEDENSAKNGGNDARIPLPWELLQPVLRILGHCLLGPLNVNDVKDAASVAVRRLYARASHDLVPQAILATRSLIQLDRGAREAASSTVAVNASGSNANTPSKAKKPEILLVSK
ncbi:hypothetical protein BUALT_Bualt15G0071900 [Buddleja alternifolia]|uniref:Hyccin n=1 Tax=Buddleja alternifolia TaxID=168488 RepID=A0AAV6WIN2_9LAMI|nr:hypothetical protein BUALT_Bualt15G0071900 [Buddleja alternifolia]